MESIAELSGEQVSKLSSKRIPELVSEAARLDREISERQERLEFYKARLRQEVNAERGTRSAELEGVNGETVTVTLPENEFVRGLWLDDEGEAWTYRNKEKVSLGKLKRVCGKHFKKLFLEQWKPSKFLDKLAPALLGEKKGAALIEKLSFASTARVSFKK